MSISKEDLTKVVERLSKAQAYQRGAWALVIEKARAYAQMKTFGTYNDPRGGVISVGFREQEDMTKMYEENLLREVMRAFAEDAQMGITVSENLK